MVIFYVLSPIPTMIARRHSDGTGGTNSTCMETAIFLTMGLLVSSFALPMVLAHAGAVSITIIKYIKHEQTNCFGSKTRISSAMGTKGNNITDNFDGSNKYFIFDTNIFKLGIICCSSFAIYL